MTVTELTYEAKIEDWRAQAEADLRADDGWLAVAGLFWLREGVNSFGSDPTNDIVLPAVSPPGTLGSFNYYDGQVALEIAAHAGVKLNRKPATARVLRSTADGAPDL
ncbi:MAG TPA: hypothetical protein VFU22_18390, partial [Roseiflexaceae bacterium]|nr:hypothetical protein [Roseiflexaceae bacterium]